MALRVWLPLNGTLENKGISSLINVNIQSSVVLDNNGKIGKCYTNSGTTACVATPITFSANEFSLCAWVKINTKRNNWCRAIGLYGSGTYMGLACEHTNGTSLGFHYYKTIDGTNTSIFDTYPLNASTNIWTHFTMCYDGIKFYIYKDGALLTSGNANRSNIQANMTTLYLFGGTSGNSSLCSLNDIRLYDHCLSAAEVHEISQGLVLHYKLDSFQGGFGNPNLVAGSNTTSTSTNRWGASSAVGGNTSTIVQDENGHICVQVTRDATAQSSWDYLYYSNLLRNLIKTDTTYTVSFDCKPSVDGSISFTGFLNGNATNYMTSSTSTIQGTCHANQWNHMVYRCTTKVSFSDISVSGQVVYFSRSGSLRGVNTTVLFKNIKVEEGTIDTPWCPADSELTIDRTHIQDSSGYGHNGIIEGNISLDNNTPRYLSATHFQPSSGIFNNINITFDSFTISFWAKHTAQNKMLMGSNASISNKNTNWYWYGDNSFKYASGEFYYTHNAGTSEALLGTWIHFVATYDGSVITVYRNGVKEGTKTASGSMLMSYVSVGNGYTGTSYWAEGWVSDFRIYCTALSADDVLSLYHTAAKVDNLGGLHTYELKETGTVPQVLKKGIVQHGILREAAALNSGPTVSYKPAANASNSCATGVIVDFSKFADEGQPLTCTLNCDISWSGLAAGTGGTFRVLLQGSNRKKATNSFAWEGANYVTNGYNFTSLITANSTGSTHRTYTFTIPATWFDTYNGSYFGIRTDYANGTGTITISNIKVTIATNSFKIKSNSIQAENLIEF